MFIAMEYGEPDVSPIQSEEEKTLEQILGTLIEIRRDMVKLGIIIIAAALLIWWGR